MACSFEADSPLDATISNNSEVNENTATESVLLQIQVEPALVTAFMGAQVRVSLVDEAADYAINLDNAGQGVLRLPSAFKQSPFEVTVTQELLVLKAFVDPLTLGGVKGTDVKVEVSATSTALFAMLDEDQDGRLSAPERRHRSYRLDKKQTDDILFYLQAAIEAFVLQGGLHSVEGHNTYQLAQHLIYDPDFLTLVVTNNHQVLATRLKELTAEQLDLGFENPESEDFLRLDASGQLLFPQNRVFVKSPWDCVDDLRYRLPAYRQQGYGIHLWRDETRQQGEGLNQHQLKLALKRLQSSKLCGNDLWGIPTIAEFETLWQYQDQNEPQLKYPLSFPQLSARYYWVNRDSSRQQLQLAIYDRIQGKLTDAPLTQAHAIYKVWQAVSQPTSRAPSNQTPEEIQAIGERLQVLYANRDPSSWPTPDVDDGIAWQPLGLLPTMAPDETDLVSKAQADLGERLFFDPKLSGSRQIACASCHQPERGWSDGLPVAVGEGGARGTRRTPSLWNVTYYEHFFWDGRADTLAEQAIGPITHPKEMNLTLSELQQRLDAGEFDEYEELSQTAFDVSRLSITQLTQALARFEQSLVRTDTPFDQFMRGQHFNDQQLWGLHLFRTKAKCMNCHYGSHFTSGTYENIGLSDYDFKRHDLGRYLVTQDLADIGKFRVPSLRELTQRAPYMHHGLFQGLEEVMLSYDHAMGVKTIPSKLKLGKRRYDSRFPVASDKLHLLHLTAVERAALVAFLQSLSSDSASDLVHKP